MTVPDWASFFDDAHWGHFLSLIDAELRTRGVGYELDRERAGVRLADGRIFGLLNLAQVCHQMSWDGWPGALAHHFGVLFAPPSEPEDLAKDFERARALCKLRLWRRDALPNVPLVAWDIADDLTAVLTLDLPDKLRSVKPDDVAAWPLAKADLWHLALRNVAADGLLVVSPVEVAGGAIVNILEGNHTYFAASHLLFLERYTGDAPHGALVAVPRRHTAVFHRIVDQGALSALLSMLQVVPRMWRDGPGSISPALYWWQPGRALVCLPTQVVDNTVEITPPAAWNDLLKRLPPRA